MLEEQLEALTALYQVGTMGRAAALLRVTPSAVSKRIAALEDRVGVPVIEPHGRRVRLTPVGERLLAEASPLLDRLAEVLGAQQPALKVLPIAATESLLSSWLPTALAAASRTANVRLELHAHRGPVLLERVRGGDYALGICPEPIGENELVVQTIGTEPLVIVAADRPPELTGVVAVWTIEDRSLTWTAIHRKIERSGKKHGFQIEVQGRVESFTALAQIARAGFAPALVPIGVARTMGVPANCMRPIPGVDRPVAVVGRPSQMKRPEVAEFVAALADVQPDFVVK